MMCKTVPLNPNIKMPLIGFGTWMIENGQVIHKVLDSALEAGYRAIDTAQNYGNEGFIGMSLEKLLAKHNLKREDVFVTSKLDTLNHGEKASKSIEQSLRALRMDYIDLFLIHWPGIEVLDPSDKKNAEVRRISWNILEKFYKAGYFRNIGVSNYHIKHLKPMLDDGSITIKPVVNQCEFHPYLFDKKLLDYCKSHNIQFQSYSTLGSHRGNKCLLADSQISLIAQKYGVKTSQVILKWALQHGVAIIPKSTQINHIRENIQLNHFTLDDKDMQDINNLNKNKRWCWDPNPIL